MLFLRIAFGLFAAAICCRGAPALAGSTLDALKAASVLRCAVSTEVSDETEADTHGDLSALGVSFCRAVAAAALGAPDRLQVTSYPQAALAGRALQAGKVDVFVGDTPNPGIERRFGLVFLAPIFFDGETTLAHKDRGIARFADLAGKRVCYISGTDAEGQLNRAAAARHVAIQRFPFEEIGEMEAALVDGKCDAQAGDRSKLAGDRANFHAMARDFELLPDDITLDPFAPAVRDGDAAWARIVQTVFFALVQAEELGVTRNGLASARQGGDPRVRELAGAVPGLGWALGLDDGWAARAIAASGNYGEMLGAAVGPGSPMRLPRGRNALAAQGGLIWAPPLR